MAKQLAKCLREKTVLEKQFETFVERLDVDNLDAKAAELVIERCRTFRDDVKGLFARIFEICDDDSLQDYIAQESTITETIDEVFLKSTRKLSEVQVQDSKTAKELSVAESVKLPKISLPTFHGNITEWITFRDLFCASVKENSTLSNAQKLQYLKLSLKGDAYRIVQSIAIADQNFDIAWNLLEERFSNKREQVFAHIQRFMAIPVVHAESPSAILNLVDSVNEIVRSLEIIGQKVCDFSDTMFLYLACQKLDANARMWWERQLSAEDVPKLSELLEFLKNYARTLQNTKPASKPVKPHGKATSLVATSSCCYCGENHLLFKCSAFLALPVGKRVEFVKGNKLCYNCLSNVHPVKRCKSLKSCFHCARKHHTVLHFESEKNGKATPALTPAFVPDPDAPAFVPMETTCKSARSGESSKTTICSNSWETVRSPASGAVNKNNCQILLCTALVQVRGAENKTAMCRCLLDSGSERSFIRKDCVEKLGLKMKDVDVSISCLGTATTKSHGEVDLMFSPHFSDNFQVSTSAFVIDQVTGNIPSVSLPVNVKNNFQDLVLADPHFYESSQIDILFGVNVFLNVMSGNLLKRDEKLPFAMSSKLGWIICGKTSFETELLSHHVSVNHSQSSLDELVKSFWDLEAVPACAQLSPEEQSCEAHFVGTHRREEDGRYSVHLPLRDDSKPLGESQNMALRRFYSLEKRLSLMPTVYNQYRTFMKEYLELNHMEPIAPAEVNSKTQDYFIPHHFVLNDSSLTTKLRVVFDASAKSSSGVSLNEKLLIGPKVQEDLFTIILRFRSKNIAVACDIQRMYRQVKVHCDDRNYQKIFWRNDVSEPVKVYRLSTVTYGTAAAPYLATRVIKELAIDEGQQFPQAADILMRNCYVDDILFSASTPGEAEQLIVQLSELLSRGGFQLHKWCCNNQSILKSLFKTEETESSCKIVDSESVKILGVIWCPTDDTFRVSVSAKEQPKMWTKRKILAEIARVFDPLGWLSPTTVSGKIFLQELWNTNLGWDDEIDGDLLTKWVEYYSQLPVLENFMLPRCVQLCPENNIQLHAFCDASEKAYCAVIYLRTTAPDGSTRVSLLTAKTRVAPRKVQSLPRLELCAALLLSSLTEVVSSALDIHGASIYAWTDSMIVLHWLRGEPCRWKTFVANRTSKIKSVLPLETWRHVRGEENPADCATRGLLPSELISCKLWLEGPSWLHTEPLPLNENLAEIEVHATIDPDINSEVLKEEKKSLLCHGVTDECPESMELLNKFSSLTRLQRVTAYCLRFAKNCRVPQEQRTDGFLTTTELKNALLVWVRLVQGLEFKSEIGLLRQSKPIPPQSKILPLCPFLDLEGVLRVGGRLRHSQLNQASKHPILMPKRHRLTELIVMYYHLKNLHAGPQLLRACIQKQFWIIAVRDVIRQLLRKCLMCIRNQAQVGTQLMGDLPPPRVIPSRPFTECGVDYAGPFILRVSKGRSNKTFKAYISLFICFATRAIHLELVTELTSDAFLAALKRFVARRGKCRTIYSDCGTNFVGAARELKAVAKLFQNDEKVVNFLAEDGIAWKFNPPASPHAGGLWESAVKSVKYHLKRVCGNVSLTFEEMYTILTQVEACLNSRPLCPLSNDPNDLQSLTPGHFLVGGPLTAPPEVDLTSTKMNRVSRWQLLQKLTQHFWKRWTNEYLSCLQKRTKWCSPQRNIKIGELVLLKDDRVPPLKWKLGRVVNVFPGHDGYVRTVSVKTAEGVLKRTIQHLCPLPVNT